MLLSFINFAQIQSITFGKAIETMAKLSTYNEELEYLLVGSTNVIIGHEFTYQ